MKPAPALAAAALLLAAAPAPAEARQQPDLRALRRDCHRDATRDNAEATAAACAALLATGAVRPGDLAHVHHARGWALLVAERPAEAVPDLEATIRLTPDFAEPYIHLAGAHVDIGEPDRAAALLDQAEALEPAWSVANYRIGQTRYQLNDLPGAIRAMRRAVDQNGGARAENGLCWYLVIANQSLDEAARACDRALRREPWDADILDSRALLKLRRGDWAGAEADYISALALNPELALSRYGRGLARIRLGDRERGEADLAAAVEKDPTVAEMYARWGLGR